MVVGYDPREAIAYHVFCQSVLEKSTIPVWFMPLSQLAIQGYRETKNDGTNQFTYTRFLTPHLLDFRGWAIFADGDMVCNRDIAELWALRDPTKAIQVVKHCYKTKAQIKYLGSRNEDYPRKNWSSLVLWNCEHPAHRCLTPDFVASKSGAYLHRFQWLNDEMIGELPISWNWLAIEYETNNAASLVHYTLGTPCFEEFMFCEMSSDWHQAFSRTLRGTECNGYRNK